VVTEDLVIPSPSALKGYWADCLGCWLVLYHFNFLLRAHHVIFTFLLIPSRFLEMTNEKRLFTIGGMPRTKTRPICPEGFGRTGQKAICTSSFSHWMIIPITL